MWLVRKLLRRVPWRATTFRLVLSYLGIFTFSALALLSLVSWSTAMFIDWQVQETVEAETAGLIEQYQGRGITYLSTIINQRIDNDEGRRAVYLLLSPQGQILAGNLRGWPLMLGAGANQGWLRLTAEDNDGRMRDDVFMARAYSLPGGYRLLVGRSLTDANRMKSNINRALAWGLALTLLLGLVGGHLTTRHLLRRVDAMNQTARKILGGQLQSRMKLSRGNDEFDRLARSFNAMMDQIERLVDGMRTVTDNVAHDLRTPLTRLRTRIEVVLNDNSLSDEERTALEACLADADHLLLTFNALLTIGQAESGQHLHHFAPVDMSRLVEDATELYEPLAEEKGLTLHWCATEGVTIAGNRHLLFQALANMMDNAIKYTPAGGIVQVRLDDEGHTVRLSVADNGCGIPLNQRDKVLDRFVRLDATRSSVGNGLGLSLVKAVAQLHRAELILADADPHGLLISLVFEKGQTVGG